MIWRGSVLPSWVNSKAISDKSASGQSHENSNANVTITQGKPVSLVVTMPPHDSSSKLLQAGEISRKSSSVQKVALVPLYDNRCWSLSGSGPSKSKIIEISVKSIKPFASTSPSVIYWVVPAKALSPSSWPAQCKPVNTESMSFLVL